jgi:hypothetical protein
VLHDAAHPYHRGDLIFRQADALALEVGRFANSGVGAHVNAGMPEQARHKSRNADIGGRSSRDRPDVARKRQLGYVEFPVAEGAKENLFGIERQIGDRAAFHRDAAVLDGAGAVIIAAGNGYRHLDHGDSSNMCKWCKGSDAEGQSLLASVPSVKSAPCALSSCCGADWQIFFR